MTDLVEQPVVSKRELVQSFRARAFINRDLSAIDDCLVERDDLLIQVIHIRMRHTGEFMGMPATNRSIVVGGFDAFRIRGDKLAEHWGVYDIGKIPDTLGMSPASWGEMWHD